MSKPILVVMAAGLGSRYGGLKQIDPVGNHGQLIIDYSIYDAKRAGFETVVFVIKPEIEQAFREAIGDRMSTMMEVRYAYQRLENLPEGYHLPKGREKPWGTAHALLSAEDVIDGQFAVINADDYYGPEGFAVLYDFLVKHADNPCDYAMVGYLIQNTVTEYGHVARGVCEVNGNGYLDRVVERTHIEKTPNGARYTEDDGKSWVSLNGDTVVSMNLWGFSHEFLQETKQRFAAFLDDALATNPLKAEYFLPSVVTQLLDEGKVRVNVLKSHDRWYGVTYREDKAVVQKAIACMTASGLYPDNLWNTQE